MSVFLVLLWLYLGFNFIHPSGLSGMNAVSFIKGNKALRLKQRAGISDNVSTSFSSCRVGSKEDK